MRVEETRYLLRADVAAALEEAFREDGNGVLVGLNELGEDGSEADLGIEVGDVAVLPGQ